MNGYLAEIAGQRITAKDFRTWRGTVSALAHLRQLPADAPPTHQQEVAAIDAAATALRNTRAVARAHYVHPGLIAAYESGALGELLAAGAKADAGPVEHLHSDEVALLDLLPRLPT